MSNVHFKNIIISRTDNIGDVVLTLPLAGIIKENIPNAKIYFLGKNYTEPLIKTCANIDEFLNWDELKKNNNALNIFKILNIDSIIHVFPDINIAKAAAQAKIKTRIGTNRRIFHWLYCNKLVNLTRKKSNLHEAQLNIKLLEPLKIATKFSLQEIPKYYAFKHFKKLGQEFLNLIDTSKFNLILHPKSKGSAREWSKEHFITFANILADKNYQVFFSGSKAEQGFIENEIMPFCKSAINISGKLDLGEFISFIQLCDGLIANSTGPLHIAAALEKKTIGLYPPIQSMLPSRWAPIGTNASFIVGAAKSSLQYCKSPCLLTQNCTCMNAITPDELSKIVLTWRKEVGQLP